MAASVQTGRSVLSPFAYERRHVKDTGGWQSSRTKKPDSMVAPHPQQSSTSGASPRGITAFDWTRTLGVLSDPCFDPLFWRAERLGSPSAWWQHVPLAHWIVGATAPRLLVELGTHTGVSYAAFCQPVLRERLATRCHAERAARPALHPLFWEDHDTFSHPTKLAPPQAPGIIRQRLLGSRVYKL